MMISAALRHRKASFFVFQQDSAPSHAKDTIALLGQEAPDFIPPTFWPSNLPMSQQ